MGILDDLFGFKGESFLDVPVVRTPVSKPQLNHRDLAHVVNRFLQELHHGANLNPGQARDRVDGALVEILMYGQHSSNGLLISEHGLFLTALHCVSQEIVGSLSVSVAGYGYPLQEVLYAIPRLDLALVKAAIPGDAKPIQHAFYSGDYATLTGSRASLLSRWERRIIDSVGTIIPPPISTLIDHHEHIAYPDQTIALEGTDARKGTSGGTILAGNGHVLGINYAGNVENTQSTAIRITAAIGMLHGYVQASRR